MQQLKQQKTNPQNKLPSYVSNEIAFENEFVSQAVSQLL